MSSTDDVTAMRSAPPTDVNEGSAVAPAPATVVVDDDGAAAADVPPPPPPPLPAEEGTAADPSAYPASPSSSTSRRPETTTEKALAELLQLNDTKFKAAISPSDNTHNTSNVNNATSSPSDDHNNNTNANANDISTAVLNASKGLASSNADAILLSMLDSEVHRLKTLDKSQKEGLERFERDGKRMTVLLAMSHDQLEQLKIRNDKLNSVCDEFQKEITTLKDRNALLEKKFTLAVEDKAAFKVMNDQNNSAGKAVVARLELENKLQQETIGRCRAEITAAEARHAEEKALAEVERRKAFEMKVALETRLKSVEEELSFIQELRQKETKTATTREYDLSVVVQTLKKEVNALKGSQESTSKSAFETMSSVRAENFTLSERCIALEKELLEANRSNFEKLTNFQTLLDAKSEQLQQQESAAKAREKVSETQIQKFITDLRVAQEEVNALAERETSKNMDQVTKIIQLNSELSVAQTHITEALQEIDHLKAKLRQQVVDAAVAKEMATTLLNQSQREQQEKYSLKVNELNAVAVELQWKSEKLASTESRLAKALADHDSLREKYQNETSALRREIEDYKQVVVKLNTHIEANVENRLLSEQNQNLSNQIETMKGQLLAMNAALSHARTEMNVGDSHRTLLLMDQMESQLSRLDALEKERLEARPLIDTLTLYFKGSTAAASVGGSSSFNAQPLLLTAGGGGGTSNFNNTSAMMSTVGGGGFGGGGALSGLLAIANSRGAGVSLGGGIADGLGAMGSGSGGGTAGAAAAAAKNVSFQRYDVGAAAAAGGAVGSSTSPSKMGANNTVVSVGGTSNSLALASLGGGGDSSIGALPIHIEPEVLNLLRTEEASVHRNLEAFYRRFGGSVPLASEGGGGGGGGGNTSALSRSYGGGGGRGGAAAGNTSSLLFNNTTNVSSSLPTIPTTKIKRVN